MKLRTSFCKSALVKKDITRFAPLWVLYTIWTLLIMLTTLSGTAANNVKSVGTFIRIYSMINMGYAFLSAQLLFGDLFNTRLCNALHAMPISRTHQFWSHVIAGLLFSLLPDLVAAIALMFKLGAMWYMALLWLLGLSLSYVYFFGLATLCMMLTGNRFACAALYGIINFFAYVVWWFLYSVFQPLMPGVVIGGGNFSLFCPVVLMMESTDLFNFKYGNVSDRMPTGVDLCNGWITFGIFGLVGIGLLVLALVLYRRRALERAGDFLTIKALEPVFLVVYTLCAGAFCSLFAMDDELLPVFLAIGILIGYFTGRMLLERTVRVLHKRAFVGLVALALLLAVALGLTKLDVFGVVRYVPEAEDVESVRFSCSSTNGYYADGTLNTPEDLALVEQIHRTFVEHRDDEGHFVYLDLTYTLKNGRTVERSYHLYSTVAETSVDQLLKLPQVILGFSDPEEAASAVQYCYVNKLDDSMTISIHATKNKVGLLEAMYQDVCVGEIDKENAHYIVEYDLDGQYKQLYIGKEWTNTVAWLDAYIASLDR